MKYFSLLLLLITINSFNAQTVDYFLSDELPKVRKEKIEPNGSIWYSYVKQDTFHLDSISPVGQIYSTYQLSIDTIGQYNGYYFHESKGLVITRAIDSTQNCSDCKSVITILYDLQGKIIWDDIQYPITYTEDIRFAPEVNHDSLIVRVTSISGDGFTSGKFLFYDWSGNVTGNQWIGECITEGSEQYNWLWLISSRVACYYGGNNTYPGPDGLFRYDTNFINAQGFNAYKQFLTANYYPNNTPIFGSKIQIIDSSHFCGIAYPQSSDYKFNCFITLENNKFTWDSLGFNLSHKILDAKKHEGGFLFLTAKKDPSTTYNGTIVTLFWYNETTKNTSEIWSTTVLGELMHGELNLLVSGNQTDIFINVFKSDFYPTVEPTANESDNFYNIKLTFTDVISTITPIKTESYFTIYPNPANQYTYIQSSNNGHLEMFDLSGKLLMTTVFNQAQTQLDLSPFKNGIYILKFTSDNGSVQTEKLIISK